MHALISLSQLLRRLLDITWKNKVRN